MKKKIDETDETDRRMPVTIMRLNNCHERAVEARFFRLIS